MKSVGIDIGGTYIRCGIFDKDFKMISHFKTRNDRALSAEANLLQVIRYLEDEAVDKLYKYRSIGVGAPGPISTRTGVVINPPNLSKTWHNFSIVDFLERETGLKTNLNSDANLAGLAEAVSGAGTPYKTVFYITMSTGIGGGYIREKKIVNGSNSAAAEIYNLIINEKSDAREGVNPGAVNEQCSGTGLLIQSKRLYGHPIEGREIFDLYNKGDNRAIQLVDNLIDGMARTISNISCVIDPDVFIIGGSILLNNIWLLEQIMNQAKKYVIFPEYLRVEMAEHGDNAGLIGAAMLP